MPRTDTRTSDAAKRIINLSPDRIPEFINQSRTDRSLSEMIVTLNRQFNEGTRREVEMAEEALRRLGFVLDD